MTEDFVNEIIEPEIEKIENEENVDTLEIIEEEWKGDKEFLERIKMNPYSEIRNFYERILPCMGSKCFSIASLVPISHILPKIIRNGKEIRVHINVWIMTPTGGGKSTLCREFENVCYFPLSTKKMTTPRVYHELKLGEHRTLIVEDIATWVSDDEKIKILEGVIGEEESISHETMRNIKNGGPKHVNVVSFLASTPEVISNNRIQHGILRRVSPLIVFLSKEENDKISDYIHNSMGKDSKVLSSEPIRKFYEEIYNIQKGLNKNIPPIRSYIIPDFIREELKNYIKPLSQGLFDRYGSSSASEIEEVYRFLVCHAGLNIFKKIRDGKFKDGNLEIDEEDLRVAKGLIGREISSKNIILRCIEQIDYWNIRTREQLRAWENKRREQGKKPLPKDAEFIIKGLVENPKGKHL